MGERPLRSLGKSYPREDGPEMVAGLSRFVEDLQRPGMLYGAVVRSGRPHARVLRVDASRAAKAPGVACVLTAADVPVNSYGLVLPDQPVLCGVKVRYEGDPVAALCATSWEAAEAAARLVRVRYEDLPAVTDPEEALRPESSLVHESHPTGNLVAQGSVIRGDIERGFSEAEVIVEARYRTGPQEHAAIEPHLTLAEVDPAGRLNVYVSSQTPFRIQADLARVLKLPLSRVRVVSCVSGGAFGGKHEIMLESLASLCAIKTRRPVTFRMTREEEFTVSTIRHAFTMDFKTGLTREGRITAVHVRCLLDGGAYCAAGTGVGAKGALMAPGPYVIPNVRSDFRLAYTNNGFAGAVRGFGATQTTFACERHMDLIARKLGIDPVELRRRNAMKTGDPAHSGDAITSCGLAETMDRAAAAIGWDGIGRGRRSGRYRRGRGMAAMIYPVAGFGQATPAAVFARVNQDATLTVITGIVDVGQGANIILRQIAAEELGVPLDHVQLINGDTAIAPFDPGSTGSRVAHVGGLGVKKAVARVKEKLLARAAAALPGQGLRVLRLRHPVRRGGGGRGDGGVPCPPPRGGARRGPGHQPDERGGANRGRGQHGLRPGDDGAHPDGRGPGAEPRLPGLPHPDLGGHARRLHLPHRRGPGAARALRGEGGGGALGEPHGARRPERDLRRHRGGDYRPPRHARGGPAGDGQGGERPQAKPGGRPRRPGGASGQPQSNQGDHPWPSRGPTTTSTSSAMTRTPRRTGTSAPWAGRCRSGPR
ncbi:MAG: xanthine dehydrogenase family protein [Candidatus Tectomicrobia bacterium]|nr:xanthine dehydrogenase family protein [Candidatus Tectomicrobia bacterium]